MHSRAPVRLKACPNNKLFILFILMLARWGGWQQFERGMHSLGRSGKDGEQLLKFWWKAVQSCSFFQKYEIFREEGDELKYISIQNSLEMQHFETAGLDAERRYLFGKNKPLGVKDFCSKFLKRSSKNTSGWSTTVITGAEHEVHKTSTGRQVASFQNAKCCWSTVSHTDSCTWMH